MELYSLGVTLLKWTMYAQLRLGCRGAHSWDGLLERAPPGMNGIRNGLDLGGVKSRSAHPGMDCLSGHPLDYTNTHPRWTFGLALLGWVLGVFQPGMGYG